MVAQKVRKKYATFLKVLISAGLLAWLVRSIEWQHVADLLAGAKIPWLAAALGWIVVSVAVSAYKWQLLNRAAGLATPYRVLWQSYWACLFFNNFLPSSIGGDAVRIYWTGKYVGDMAGAAATVVAERILATAGLSLLALLAWPFSRLDVPYLVMFFAVLALFSLALLLLILYPKLLESLQRFLHRFPGAARFLESFSAHGLRLRRRSDLLLAALGWSVVFQGCVVMVNYCLFRALDIPGVTLLEACVLIPATSVAAMIPLGINGYGTREGAYVALFSSLGVSRAGALTVSVLFAVLVSLTSLWGGWIWLRKGQEKEWEDERIDGGESGRLVYKRI